MTTISRRQKDILLNDVARMINNNNHTAFANHAKIAETVSNGDLKFYIDSPKKEFVIKYGKKEIRLNCSEQCIKELNEIVFKNGAVIKGISDNVILPSSTIALSTKGAQDIIDSVETKADKNHTHSEYLAAEHNHDNTYAKKSHTHWDMPAKKEEFEEKIKDIVLGPIWLRVLKNVFTGIEVASDTVQYGLVAGIQAQVTALHTAMAANGLIDTVQTASTLGTTLFGFASTIKDVADVIDTVGNSIDGLRRVCTAVSKPIRTASEAVKKYSNVVDKFIDCGSRARIEELIKFKNTAIKLSSDKLPNIHSTLTQSLIP